MRYAVEFFPNKNYATIHFDVLLPKFRFEYGRLSGGILNDDPLSPAAQRLGSEVIVVPGVEECSTNGRYQLRLQRGGAFGWDEIIPGVVATVVECIAPDSGAVQVEHNAEVAGA